MARAKPLSAAAVKEINREAREVNRDARELNRGASEELGNLNPTTSYNQKTGRPIRKSAGRKTLNPGYLDSAKAIEDDFSDICEEEEEEEEIEIEEIIKPKKRAKTTKRKRTPSPTPPRLSPERFSDVNSLEGSPDPVGGPNTNGADDRMGSVSIVANIPFGFSGPLHIKLDVSDLLGANKKRRLNGISGDFGAPHGILSKSAKPKKCGFLKMPAELRNEIYRHLFLSKEPLDLRGDHLCRSGALLSTCRQVYDESRNILYGENSFMVDRDKSSRRHMWQRESKEVGYKHFRVWLSHMSPVTRSMIREIDLELDDALPSHTPELKNNEERRYVHDGHLIEALKLLGQDGKLKRISLTFAGRRSLARTDHRFVKYLCKIKVDEIVKRDIFSRYSYPYNRVNEDVLAHIRAEMIRKVKLYASEDS